MSDRVVHRGAHRAPSETAPLISDVESLDSELESAASEATLPSLESGCIPVKLREIKLELRASDVQPQAQTALANSTIYALRELTVEPVDDALLISGSVSSFYYKQLAQEVVRAVAGDIEVVNTVRVE